GRVLLALRDPDNARRAFERARTLEPGSADARLGHGMAALLVGRDREAAEAWRDVIDVAADPRVVRAMVQLYDSLGDAAAADEARARLALLSSR
ncbi:MAG TPA: tetratricopeptide repeat protein, partial [Solirubrobacteraceae bacterium]